jgi:hypothetical protein
MHVCRRRRLWLAVAVMGLPLVLARPAWAHGDYEVGPLRLSIGWAEEPAYSGLANGVEVTVTLEDGTPVTDLGGGSLAVEVTFGTETSVRALAPVGAPGVFLSRLVPTQAGTYAFHLTGTVLDVSIDITATCSEETFECVADVADAQFPSRDPSAGELSQRLERELARADRAESAAVSARRLAIGGLAFGALALATVVALEVRRRRSTAP